MLDARFSQLVNACVEACRSCTEQCNGCATECELIGGMDEGFSMSMLCSDECCRNADSLLEGTFSYLGECKSACERTATANDAVTRHMDACTQAAKACREAAISCQSLLSVLG